MADWDRYGELAVKIGMKDSEIVPRLFALIAGDREAELLLALPSYADDCAELSGLSEDEVERTLEGLFIKGVVFRKR
ncbi:MAG: 4Fe-4S ferredoxin, partial [Actinobacteria bacterium]|nr:4Fe-4S ferredoxin [Actinomycetota bacterium]